MSARSLEQLIARYEDQETLTAAQYTELSDALLENPDLVAQITDDRAVDGMLSLIASIESDEDDFVSQCLKRVPIVEAGQNKEESATPVVHDNVVIDVGSVSSSRLRTKKTAQSRFSLRLWISMAACVLVLISVGARFLVNSEDSASLPNAKRFVEANRNDDSMPRHDSGDESIGETKTPQSPDLETSVANSVEGHVNAEDPAEQLVQVDSNSGEYEGSNSLEDVVEVNPNTSNPFAAPVELDRGIATIVGESGTIWEPSLAVSGDRMVDGEYRLVKGKSAIHFDHGVKVVLQAPAAIVLHGKDHLHLSSGNSILEVPEHVTNFKFSTDDGHFFQPINARIQIAADPDSGTIALLTQGKIQQRSLESGNRRGLQLSEDGVFQSVIRPASNSADVSRVTIARGNDKFIGQIGEGENQLQTSSPVVMANVLSEISEPSRDREAPNSLLDNWSEFVNEVNRRQLTAPNQLMELMRKYGASKRLVFPEKNPGYTRPENSSSFQGSISINGETHSFDSPDAYEDAMRRLHGRFELPDVNQTRKRLFDLLPGFPGDNR